MKILKFFGSIAIGLLLINTSFAETGDTDFEETGYTFGLQFIHPLGTSEKISYLIRAGGIYNHIEVENSAGDITADSGHGLGWEIGAGVQVYFGKQLET